VLCSIDKKLCAVEKRVNEVIDDFDRSNEGINRKRSFDCSNVLIIDTVNDKIRKCQLNIYVISAFFFIVSVVGSNGLRSTARKHIVLDFSFSSASIYCWIGFWWI